MSRFADLKVEIRNGYQVFVNDRLVAEVLLGEVTDRDTLERQLAETRIVRQVATTLREGLTRFGDPIEAGKRLKCPAAFRGFEAGMRLDTMAHPMNEDLRILREYGPEYELGYRVGSMLRACHLALEAEANR